jgi:hypothetical protein
MQPECPMAAQLLYNLGLEVDQVEPPDTCACLPATPWPPLPSYYKNLDDLLMPLTCFVTPLSLQETSTPLWPITTAAVHTYTQDYVNTARANKVRSTKPSKIVTQYDHHLHVT